MPDGSVPSEKCDMDIVNTNSSNKYVNMHVTHNMHVKNSAHVNIRPLFLMGTVFIRITGQLGQGAAYRRWGGSNI